jgi:hypothetical protein
LRDAISVDHPPNLAAWDQQCATFLRASAEAVGSYEADELLHRITLQDFSLDRDLASKARFKSKIRLTFQNGTGRKVVFNEAIWSKG